MWELEVRTRNTGKELCAVRVSKKPEFRRRPGGTRVTQQSAARRPEGQAGEAGAGARAGNDDASAGAAVDAASPEATRAPA